MNKFDLSRALAGDKVVTRDGREVTQLVKFDVEFAVGCADVIFAVLEGSVESWEVSGSYHGTNCGTDLFMAPNQLSGFMNVYPNGGGHICKTKQECDDQPQAHSRIACIDLSQFTEGHGLYESI